MGTLHEYICKFMLWPWEMFQSKFMEKIKTHILRSFFSPENRFFLWDNVEEYGRVRQVKDDSVG